MNFNNIQHHQRIIRMLKETKEIMRDVDEITRKRRKI